MDYFKTPFFFSIKIKRKKNEAVSPLKKKLKKKKLQCSLTQGGTLFISISQAQTHS